MKVCLFLMLVALMCGTLISADSTTVKSDTTPRKMHPVDINADYLRSKINSSFSPLSILTADQLAALGSWQVSDAIVQLPSAYIKNYGGLNALKTISLRATTSQQTLVLLDGIRIASSATGTVDLSAVPLVFLMILSSQAEECLRNMGEELWQEL
ncbi:MAG: TonB-dependent receptor plug domain-containing protein [Ignavibacteria bacterium]|nr:TonB-dependent receptor plug domain-containing protein [Ignavibacteria bacterium]